MKVVLFCGGQGLRLRDYSENIPKPMVPVGYRPIMWHLMKYYAHYGHKDFILCLGHKSDVIKDYFLNYNEAVTNDFVLRKGGRDVEMLATDIDNWSITFCDTGIDTNIGQRLLRVREHLAGEEMFLANYSDNVSDVPLPQVIDQFRASGKIASFVSVCPSQTFHVVEDEPETGLVSNILDARTCGIRINGGFFTFRQEFFDYINEGEEMVLEPFRRLIDQRQLINYRHDGFWACMDTFKEKQILEDYYARGKAPWKVWGKKNGNGANALAANGATATTAGAA